MASLLEKAGYAVTREYYYNDAGAQIDSLARSTHLRYREALGETIDEAAFEGLYPGEYLKLTGAALVEQDGDKWLGRCEAEWLGPVRAFESCISMALRSFCNARASIWRTRSRDMPKCSPVYGGSIPQKPILNPRCRDGASLHVAMTSVTSAADGPRRNAPMKCSSAARVPSA